MAPVLLDVTGLHREGVLREISLQIRAGEIVGLAGLVGSGRSELARAIAGADPIDRGTIVVEGTARRIRSPADAMAAGMAFLPESRKDDGLFEELSLAANTTFADLGTVASRVGVLRRALERAKTRSLLDSLSVEPPNPAAKVANLSGGNQQKVLFARWLFRNPRVLILDEPTRGVDVAARAAIHRLITNLAATGTAVLLISSEIEEVLGLAHRVLVMRRGSITREFDADPPMEAVMEAAFGLGGSAAG
jgi:ABC-type sugar transport system ATPase subunit